MGEKGLEIVSPSAIHGIGNGAFGLVSHQLQLGDFFRLQAAGTSVRRRCMEDDIWCNVMEKHFSAFRLHPALLQPAAWHVLGPLFRELQQTHAVVAGVGLGQKVEVQRLTNVLHAANRSNRHVGPSQVFVGLMRVASELLSMAVEKQREVQDVPSCVADAFVLHSNLLDDPAAGPSPCVSNPEAVSFHGPSLYFKWQNCDLFVAIWQDAVSPSDIPMMGNQDGLEVVTLDIAACSSAFTLNHRGVEVAVNGPWKMCTTGFFVMTGGKAATVEALSAGVPCVVCMRFGQIMQPLHMARTLHLAPLLNPSAILLPNFQEGGSGID